MNIPFNKPYICGKEAHHIAHTAYLGKISGNGEFTGRCHRFFEKHFGFRKVLLTTSCTDALEMAALLLRIKEGDEVILPSYTFVSTANAFYLRGAKLIFADCEDKTPNIDAEKLESLINEKTKAIVVVHYAGIACDMDKLKLLADKHDLFLIEDAAHAIDSYYKGKALGSIGHLGTFSFHETKNIISGEGGMLAINEKSFVDRAEIIWEKGTNRVAFFRGEIDKYDWVDIGSSFLPSEMMAAFLFAQLEHLKIIQQKRKSIWQFYYDNLKALEGDGKIHLPYFPEYACNNASMFYFRTNDNNIRNKLLKFLNKNGIQAVFHYLPLHLSEFYKNKHDGRKLPNAVRYSETVVRLPFFYELRPDQQEYVCKKLHEFFH